MAMLQDFDVEESWHDVKGCYSAAPKIARWENCREQGYVVSMENDSGEQINIAFFEHRNSDSICAVEWKQNTLNAPTIDTAKFGEIYKSKEDVSHTVPPGCVSEMAEWIEDRLTAHWAGGQIK